MKQSSPFCDASILCSCKSIKNSKSLSLELIMSYSSNKSLKDFSSALPIFSAEACAKLTKV